MQAHLAVNKMLVLLIYLASLLSCFQPGFGSTTQLGLSDLAKCPDVCPTAYNVVCAWDNGYLRTFASRCVLRMYNCKYQKDYRIVANCACQFVKYDKLRKKFKC